MSNHFLFFPQIKNKPYPPREKYPFILETVLSRTIIFLIILMFMFMFVFMFMFMFMLAFQFMI
jgi:hypothetical protein